MQVALWAEIRRLHEVERLSQREIALRLGCSRRTVGRALALPKPPNLTAAPRRASLLDAHHEKIRALLEAYPTLSAVRIEEELRRGDDPYSGGICTLRRYLRQVRPAPARRVYQEMTHDPGQAMQVDWGCCGTLRIGSAVRKVSVLSVVLGYSRLCYIEFTLSQRKAEFYRAIVHALEFFGGAPRRLIVDNLKAAVLRGSGQNACFHEDFLALCGHYHLHPVACAARDPESKGMVEAGVKYVKQNALAGRDDQLQTFGGYQLLQADWRDNVANVRLHPTTRERPVDRFEKEREHLRALPATPFCTDEIVSTVATSHARVRFDGNRYSVPPRAARQTVTIRAGADLVRILWNDEEIARHERCYDRGQLVLQAEHRQQAVALRPRPRLTDLEQAFDALGEAARKFQQALRERGLNTPRLLRRLLELARTYESEEVLQALSLADSHQAFDASSVEAFLLQARRRRDLPSPTPLRPARPELLEETHFDPPDPALYDRLCGDDESEPENREPENREPENREPENREPENREPENREPTPEA